MVKRLLVSIPVFFGLLLLLLVPTNYRLLSGRATGVSFVVGFFPAGNAVRILLLVLIALVAYWISGKLVGTT